MILIQILPTELKEELVRYCIYFAFILDKTGLFKVPRVVAKASRTWLVNASKVPTIKILNNFLLLKELQEKDRIYKESAG